MLGVSSAMVALLTLTGCGGKDDPVGSVEQKQSADATVVKTAGAGAGGRFLPLLRKYHDRATWPEGYDMTPEQMWKQVAAAAGDVVLDDTAAEGQVAIVNQCAWALKAIDAVRSDADTTEVRAGLVRAGQLMPGGDEYFAGLADQLAVGNLESTQAFVTANTCHDGFE